MEQEAKKQLKVILSGGGTGGHVYPALAIAQEIRRREPGAELLFVGAEGKMEMEKVPQHGFRIEGLPIAGIQRGNMLKNLSLPFKLFRSLRKVARILKKFKPDVAIGVGGYASGPLLFLAAGRRIPCLIQEQNSYPGLTNKILAGRAKKICVAYPGLEKFFPKQKIVFTGNPVRDFSEIANIPKEEALATFGLKTGSPCLLVIGGSLGARTINNSLLAGLDTLMQNDFSLIWQTGKNYFENIQSQVGTKYTNKLKVQPFIDKMDMAYAAADVVISRAGAISISELALAGKPVILVPSPNVAEDHQTKNALALTDNDAAEMVSDADAPDKLVVEALKLLADAARQEVLKKNIVTFARPMAAKDIVDQVFALAQKNGWK